MKNLFLLIFIGLLPFFLYAQQGAIKGKLTDSTHQSINNATISILQKKDSSLLNYILSDSKGSFEIKNLSFGDYQLLISFMGYQTFKKYFSITADKRILDFGVIILEPEFKTLSGVVVSDASPVRINGDTISFKARAFNAKPNATVEDVLKKIPGIQVQKDGAIKAMGEQVQKVYVDGKEFFGNDPKIATRNLTADMVDQIQVFDDMSEQSRFTKIDDGNRIRSINLKLKKNKNKGDFGRASVGIGNNSRYEGNLSFNHFRGDTRISIVGSANNTNKLNYTFSDFSSAQGSASQFSVGNTLNIPGASGTGINNPITGGINFNDTWGTKIDFRGNYFYSGNDNVLAQKKFTINSFPNDSSSEITSFNNGRSNTRSHRMNGRWEYMIDSANSLLYSINISMQQFDGTTIDTSFTYADGKYPYLAAASKTNRKDKRDGIDYSGELLYRLRFKKPGRTFTLGWRNGKGTNEMNSISELPVTTYYDNGDVAEFINLNQQGQQNNESGNNIISTSYTEPIGKNKLFEINYAYSAGENISNKETYDYDYNSGKYDQLNLQQTNYFDYNNASNRIGLNFKHQMKKLNYQLGMTMQTSNLDNRSIMRISEKDTTIHQRFKNLFPTANFNYMINRSKNIRFFYRGRTNAPSVAQLQDVPDVSNPLQIKIGNPSLKQEFINNLNVSYNSFILKTQRFFTTSFNIVYTNNKIVNTIDSAGASTIIYKPENLNGSFDGYEMVSLTFPLGKSNDLNLNITNMVNLRRDANLVFKQRNFTNVLQVNQSAGINYGKEKIDLAITTGLIYNNVWYNVQQNTDNRYFNLEFATDLTYRFTNRFYFVADLNYYINAGRTAGYNQNVFLCNMSLAQKFFKKNAVEMKLTAYDILKQNKGISRNIGENYFEDIRTNVVPGFFLLSLSYNFSRFGGAKEKDQQSK